MEANLCDIDEPDSNVLLPPRKRLLAGLKKQNSGGNSQLPSTSSASGGIDSRLNKLLRSHLSNQNLSAEEIVEASKSAAAAAVKVAEAARVAAEVKAATAAKAIAAAKDALKLAATTSEEAAKRERCMKNKMKKQVPVRMLYDKHQPVENCKTDEELARKLHHAINSSPRISKNSSSSDSRSNKHKRRKVLFIPGNPKISDGVMALEGNLPSKSNENDIMDEVGLEGSTGETYTISLVESASKPRKIDQPKMDSHGVETSQLKEKTLDSADDTYSNGRKRSRIKQKKLPLSICTYKDQAKLKDELESESSPSKEVNREKPTTNNKSFTVESPSNGVILGETTPLWKCQAFKAPVCVKQDKVVQS